MGEQLRKCYWGSRELQVSDSVLASLGALLGRDLPAAMCGGNVDLSLLQEVGEDSTLLFLLSADATVVVSMRSAHGTGGWLELSEVQRWAVLPEMRLGLGGEWVIFGESISVAESTFSTTQRPLSGDDFGYLEGMRALFTESVAGEPTESRRSIVGYSIRVAEGLPVGAVADLVSCSILAGCKSRYYLLSSFEMGAATTLLLHSTGMVAGVDVDGPFLTQVAIACDGEGLDDRVELRENYACSGDPVLSMAKGAIVEERLGLSQFIARAEVLIRKDDSLFFYAEPCLSATAVIGILAEARRNGWLKLFVF